MGYPRDDEQFAETTVTEVGKGSITTADGWGIGIPQDFAPPPTPGEVVRTYGDGFGRPVRGLFIGGRKAWYRTEAEQEEKHRRDAEAYDRKKWEEFERDREGMDARFRSLPQCFRRRIGRFRRNNPDFRWQYEAYELFVCEEAVKIARALKTGAAIELFHAATWDEQRARVPDLVDGHSGNTFGASTRLAWLYVSGDEEGVEKMHGALAPLVGSEEYGCVPRTR